MSLFYLDDPKKKITERYPELNQYECFRDMRSNEYDFVWLFACQTSPLKHITSQSDRAQQAYDMAFPPGDNNQKMRYYTLKFPDNVREAIKVMSSFNPEVRRRAMNAVQSMFENLLEAANTKLSEIAVVVDEQGNAIMSIEAVNKWTAALKNMRQEIMPMVTMLEENGGFSAKADKELREGKNMHEIFMARKRAQNR